MNVPRAIAAWTRLNTDHGTKDLTELLRPAINYAENGFPVAPRVALDWVDNLPKLLGDEVSSKILTVSGEAPKAGTKFAQPLLGTTLAAIARGQRRILYW